jgi:BON domain
MLNMASSGRSPSAHTRSGLRRLATLVLGGLLAILATDSARADTASAVDLMRSIKADAALTADDQFRDLPVHVTIREGMAKVRGTVPTAELADQLVKKVQQMDGVTVVVRDHLEVRATLKPSLTLPEQALTQGEAIVSAPSRRMDAGLPGSDPWEAQIRAQALARAPSPAPRLNSPAPRVEPAPLAVAQIKVAGPQQSTSLIPKIRTTPEQPSVRQDWSVNRDPQSETLPQVIARVRDSDPRFEMVELRQEGNRLMVVGDGNSAQRGVAMSFARELSHANPPGIENVRVVNGR